MDEFERLLGEHRAALESYVRYRLSARADAEDVLQEVYIAAYRHFDELTDRGRFKPWALAIARNKCRDYFRAQAKRMEIPLESVTLSVGGRMGRTSVVRETLDRMSDIDRQILYLYYFRELPQSDIAARLGIPAGTVKSRLHNAKQHFREIYPQRTKGESDMTKLPKILPDYTIEPVAGEPFPVKWEEIMGWFLVPREGEKLSWAMYDFPERIRTEWCEMRVIGRAEVHGIEGVEIVSLEHEPMDCNATGNDPVERRFIAQLTDTHCRLLAESHMEDGVRRYYDFLDGGDFLDNWGFGEDNIGNETDIRAKGDITRDGDCVTTADRKFLLDVVGRYRATIGEKAYDTICVMDVETYNGGTTTEQYIDRDGRTILWRRFNHDEWAMERYGQRWSERLPENERIFVNGQLYVHWYDCISDYIL